MDARFLYRKGQLQKLADYMSTSEFTEEFVTAYVKDTAFVRNNVVKREVRATAALLKLKSEEELPLARLPLGTVAVFMPKNSLGLTLVKAVASSYLVGNKTRVYFPAQLKETAPVYAKALVKFLDDIEIADSKQSSSLFMRTCLNNPDVNAIVVYGDDSWIEAYKDLAEKTSTKIIFEGPGNDPLIVEADANVEDAVAGAIEGGLNNGGQSCSAFERFFIHENVYDEFKMLLVSRLSALICGAPDDPDTDVGPIASKVIFSRMVKQIEESVQLGAKLLYGGTVSEDTYTGLPLMVPAVLEGCHIDMNVVSDETFGPVFPLISFRSLEDLMPMLDATKYGLNASVYGSAKPELMNYLQETHRNVYINSTCVSSGNLSTRLMDGGFRQSGFVWDFSEGKKLMTTGRRVLTLELSKPLVVKEMA